MDRASIAVIDAAGATVTPGFCDNHTHPVIGDFTPRQLQVDFIDSYLHGGTTTMISAGEPHTPGRPTDPAGVKALAILAHRSFANAATVRREGARGGRAAGARAHRGRLQGDGRRRGRSGRRDRDLGREGRRGRRGDDPLGAGVRDARDGAHGRGLDPRQRHRRRRLRGAGAARRRRPRERGPDRAAARPRRADPRRDDGAGRDRAQREREGRRARSPRSSPAGASSAAW